MGGLPDKPLIQTHTGFNGYENNKTAPVGQCGNGCYVDWIVGGQFVSRKTKIINFLSPFAIRRTNETGKLNKLRSPSRPSCKRQEEMLVTIFHSYCNRIRFALFIRLGN